MAISVAQNVFEEDKIVNEWQESRDVPPRCPSCGGRLRPDVVWFGEMLPPDAIERAFAVSRSCDLFLSIGTSTLVHPAAGLPFEALQRGATVVEINPDTTPLTPRATFALSGASGVSCRNWSASWRSPLVTGIRCRCADLR